MERYAVYPLIGDQCDFSNELHAGADKVAASLAAKRCSRDHPLGVILIEHQTGLCWVWREWPRLTAHPVEMQVHTGDLERWLQDFLYRHRQ